MEAQEPLEKPLKKRERRRVTGGVRERVGGP